MSMSFLKYGDLVSDVTHMAHNLPKFDIVIGVPRSGLVPATLLALHWNVPISTPELFVRGMLLGSGARLKDIPEIKTALVIDDSHFTGMAMRGVKEILKNVPDIDFKYAAVYSSDQQHDLDYCYKYVPQPRWFEWNWLHHDKIAQSCFDIDGVLCRPPTLVERSDERAYQDFVERTEPRYIPSGKIRAIVTGRTERWRRSTEDWLRKHGVRYSELYMRSDRETSIIDFKAFHYARMKETIMFIEDEPTQAELIHMQTGKRVLCVTNMEVYQ